MNIFQKLIIKHGSYHQCLKAVEEFSELSRAIVRQINYGGKSTMDNLKEEIVDAHIMLEQLKIIIPKWDECLQIKLSKLEKEL